MKIMIIGAGGFIGSNLTYTLSKKHTVIPVYKNSLDIIDFYCVKNRLESLNVDVIINCLTFGGKEKTFETNIDDIQKNLLFFSNFYQLSDLYKLYINIGSGSEFDVSTDINYAKEEEIFFKFPKEGYAFSKNHIARLINRNNKFTTLRLFGCFGSNELNTRLLKRYVQSNEIFEISKNRYFDYFSIQDFIKVVTFVIENKLSGLDINCVYKEKLKLDQFLSLFNDIKKINKKFKISEESNLNYTGDYRQLYKFDLKLEGLEKGLNVW